MRLREESVIFRASSTGGHRSVEVWPEHIEVKLEILRRLAHRDSGVPKTRISNAMEEMLIVDHARSRAPSADKVIVTRGSVSERVAMFCLGQQLS